MDLTGFDAGTVDPNVVFDPIPAGWQKCVITTSEEKPTKAMTGSFLELTLEVIEGEFKGRKIFDRLNLANPNQKAVDIAQRTLSAICHAVGMMTPRHSSDLHDKPLMVKLSVKPKTDQYDASNEVKGYEACHAAQHAAAAETATAAGGNTNRPWKR